MTTITNHEILLNDEKCLLLEIANLNKHYQTELKCLENDLADTQQQLQTFVPSCI
jgi:hypothetical protein